MYVSDKAVCDKYYLVQYCHNHYIEQFDKLTRGE